MADFKNWTGDKGIFLATVSAHTGIDPTVVYAWMAQEGAFRQKDIPGFNYLNIAGGNFPSAGSAAMAVVRGVNEPQNRIIVNAARAKPTARKEIAAIASSEWDNTSKPGMPAYYGGKGVGPNLVATYESYWGKDRIDKYTPPSEAANLIAALGGTQGSDTGGSGIFPITGPPIGFTNPFGSILDFFNHLWDIRMRIGEILLGVIILILAIVIVAKQQQKNMFTFAKGGE